MPVFYIKNCKTHYNKLSFCGSVINVLKVNSNFIYTGAQTNTLYKFKFNFIKFLKNEEQFIVQKIWTWCKI